MPYLTIDVSIKSDAGAEPFEIFRKTRRVFVTQSQVINDQKVGSDGAGIYSTAPGCGQSATINLLALTPLEEPINFKLNSVGASDGVVALKAGGLLLLIDASIASGKTTNAQINNVNTTGGSDGAGGVTVIGTVGGT